jgi:DNA-binding transcriptional MerR regulator
MIRLNDNEFLIAFHSYFSSEGGKKASEFLNNPSFPISNVAQSRILNHWEKEGVLKDKREQGKGWRKYSPLEVVWVHIIVELRKFNFSLANLIALKKSLGKMSDKVEFSEMPELELYIRHTLLKPKQVFLIVFPDGNGFVVFMAELDDMKEHGLIGSHISIDLLAILKKVFPRLSLKVEFTIDWELSNSESELLSDIRSGRFDEITLEIKDRKIRRYEASEIIEDKSLFRQVAQEYPFQRIETSIKDGKKVLIRRTISKKPK